MTIICNNMYINNFSVEAMVVSAMGQDIIKEVKVKKEVKRH